MQTFGDKKYLRAAEKCGEVIWKRGLLRKGYGLCHGSAGNGYAFLGLYKATKNEIYLYQATRVRICEEIPQYACLVVVKSDFSFELILVWRVVHRLRKARLQHA